MRTWLGTRKEDVAVKSDREVGAAFFRNEILNSVEESDERIRFGLRQMFWCCRDEFIEVPLSFGKRESRHKIC